MCSRECPAGGGEFSLARSVPRESDETQDATEERNRVKENADWQVCPHIHNTFAFPTRISSPRIFRTCPQPLNSIAGPDVRG